MTVGLAALAGAFARPPAPLCASAKSAATASSSASSSDATSVCGSASVSTTRVTPGSGADDAGLRRDLQFEIEQRLAHRRQRRQHQHGTDEHGPVHSLRLRRQWLSPRASRANPARAPVSR